MKTDPNAPIYPIPELLTSYGLSKREKFAESAMQGLLASGREFKLTEAVEIADGLVWALNNHKED